MFDKEHLKSIDAQNSYSVPWEISLMVFQLFIQIIVSRNQTNIISQIALRKIFTERE